MTTSTARVLALLEILQSGGSPAPSPTWPRGSASTNARSAAMLGQLLELGVPVGLGARPLRRLPARSPAIGCRR
ncbi:hypothetical protein ACRAWF_33115 [Streptomyces sp. L7]